MKTKRIVEQERPWTLEAPPAKWERQQRIDLRKDFQPRSRAEVVVYDAEHNFIVFNAGLEDGFGKDMLVDILQDCPVKDWLLERDTTPARDISFQ